MEKPAILIQKQGRRVVVDLTTRLLEVGSVGLDFSPGDPLCMEAYQKIKELQDELDFIPPNVRRIWRNARAVRDRGGPL